MENQNKKKLNSDSLNSNSSKKIKDNNNNKNNNSDNNNNDNNNTTEKNEKEKKEFYENAGASRALISGVIVTIFAVLGSVFFWIYYIIATDSGGIEYNNLVAIVFGLFNVFNGGFAPAFIAKYKDALVKDPDNADFLFASYTKLLWLIGGFMMIISILAALYFPDKYIAICIWLSVPQIFISYFGSFTSNYLQAKNRYDIMGIVGGLYGIYLIVFGVLFLYLKLPGIWHGTIPIIITFSNFIICYYFFRKIGSITLGKIIRKGGLKNSYVKEFLRYGMQSTITNLDSLQIFGNIASFLTAFVLGLKFSETEQKNLMEIYFIIGSYVVSKIIIQFFSGPLNVEIAEAVAKNDKKTIAQTINSVGKLSLMLGLVIMVIIAAFSKTLLYVLHRNAFIESEMGLFDTNLYNQAVILFIMYLIGQFAFGFSSLFGNALVGAGAARRSSYGFGITLILISFLTPIFVYYFDLIGAGIATLIAALFLLPFIIFEIKKTLNIKLELRFFRQIPHLILLFCLFFFFPFALNPADIIVFIYQLIILIIITLVILMIFVPFWGVFDENDFQFLEELITSLKIPNAKFFSRIATKTGLWFFKLNPLNKKLKK
ncbi:MAG: hypothetical protein ACTSRZ_02510 [Promethearchaeota archaeon]